MERDTGSTLFALGNSLAATRKTFAGLGLPLLVAALLLVSIQSFRKATFLLFIVLFFGSYPAIQFHERHFFYMEVVSLLTLGLVLDQLIIHAIRVGKESALRRRVKGSHLDPAPLVE